MRRLKIDELPQLINILNGTMSIVGPRPAAVDQVEITRGGENAIAATVPCGLTSQSSLWDYIYGDQFPDENEYNDKVLPIRLKLDVYYVKHASFFGDIRLIWWTVLAIYIQHAVNTLNGCMISWLNTLKPYNTKYKNDEILTCRGSSR